MTHHRRSLLFSLLAFAALCNISGSAAVRSVAAVAASAAPVQLGAPILFVTQLPIPADFTTVASVFGNHRGALDSVGRGGDLWIRYPDGALKNLTLAAGYGGSGFQGATAIAVRDPSVSWDGTKALFSMIVGAPTKQYQYDTYYWQIYEITGLGMNQTPVITKVPNQPANFNNISPIYGADDRIIFTTDRPRNGQMHLYPQRDEYEEAPTVTGLWSFDPKRGDLFQLDHAPSGDFTPIIDSFGRVIFTRWDHLQRDQQADSDAGNGGACGYCTFNYSDESAGATWSLGHNPEVFPEPRPSRDDLLAGTHLTGHTMNGFFPWMVNEDGTEAETLNHIGRQELVGYIPASRTDDSNLTEFYNSALRFNKNPINNMLQIKESPITPGLYIGVDAPEFYTHAAGQVVALNGAPNVNGDQMAITYLTHRETSSFTSDPTPNNSGHYRDPLPMSNGTLIAAHTTETDLDSNIGTRANPHSRYDFRLKTLKYSSNGFWVSDQPLTPGITKSLSYYDPDVLVSYNGPLWELQPVEVRPRPRPYRPAPGLAAPEKQMFDQAGVNPPLLRAYLKQNNLALVVSRNVTTRDDNDRQQPFNLRIAGGGAQTVGAGGTIYDIAYMQFFQADQIRGLTNGPNNQPTAGRRVLAQPMHDPAVVNPPNSAGPSGSVVLGSDGSMAAFVPARRALTWQLTDSSGTGVVRERYWLTFQPGETRLCASCHGLNDRDQAGHTAPTNAPKSLGQLLAFWKTLAAPNLVKLTFKTQPAGLHLVIAGQALGDAQTLDWWKGYPLDLAALPQLDANGDGWVFAGWSDGGAATHTITTPTAPAIYTATFKPARLVWAPIVKR
jgi:Hydrazine synthase alpha subunit middle domain